MSTLVILVEGWSEQALLQTLLPRVVPTHITTRILRFEGKQDLERNLVPRLLGWRSPDTAFVILRDQDAARCQDIKARLITLVEQTGRQPYKVRIACHEVESWFLADLAAVGRALDLHHLATEQQRERFRTPDSIVNPSTALEDLTAGAYQKTDGSRRIGPHLDLANSRSPSFAAFITGIRALCATLPAPETT